MGDYLTKGTTYADGGTVNAANLNAHVDDAVFKVTAISSRTDVGVPAAADEFLINDASAGTLKKCTLTNLATAVTGGGSSLVHGLTAVTTLSDADEFLIWEDGVAADRKIVLSDLRALVTPVGGILQTLQDQYTANSSITSSIPYDDTVPTSSEGTQILSKAITPSSTSNKVLVRFVGYGAMSSTAEGAIAAVFRGSTCINTAMMQAHNGVVPTINFAMEVLDSPATTSAVTYTVRVGRTGGTLRMNGESGSRLFGGTSQSTLVVQEIKG